MSLRKTAKIIGVSAPYLSQMINGKRPWNEEIRARYNALSANTSQNRESLAFPIPSMNSADNTAYAGTKNLYNGDSPLFGAVAHLGERFNGIEEVESSSLSSSTIIPVLCLSGGN